MTKITTKRNKKEEQKKLIVRIVCIALAVLMIASSLGTILYSVTTGDANYSIEEMIEAGIVYLGEDGNYYFTEEYLHSLEEDHEGHDHD